MAALVRVAGLVGLIVRMGVEITARRGEADVCVPAGRLRADPAVPVARIGFEVDPAPAAELALGAESGEPPSVAADATA
ncbi:hypothetical protein Y900_000995 [Mycolicibacterium aromaticivorans JS19b1 = JCM 16368]|uniref:Uncharacterized protein n=1 Tax=Mycolicibacterium aromaticivorans JS19b1 = JCM 16368 TaxID=1440774 RepID=A0A064CCY2_9MYCO|nr:hypothetical protein Y900_000995 [Mycolicibacterium aromaticivorans JS19b1 = JCM 16368]